MAPAVLSPGGPCSLCGGPSTASFRAWPVEEDKESGGDSDPFIHACEACLSLTLDQRLAYLPITDPKCSPDVLDLWRCEDCSDLVYVSVYPGSSCKASQPKVCTKCKRRRSERRELDRAWATRQKELAPSPTKPGRDPNPGGMCPICRTRKRAVWDHDHETGEARAWICGRCNSLLGFAYDDPDTCTRAAAYLTGAIR
jgi:hypothetical protein